MVLTGYNVWHGVVCIVLILPPGDRESLCHIPNEVPHRIAPYTIVKHLMVQEVMG